MASFDSPCTFFYLFLCKRVSLHLISIQPFDFINKVGRKPVLRSRGCMHFTLFSIKGGMNQQEVKSKL
jgi:hypothetical protein